MAFFRVEHREPVLASGGGNIDTAVETIALKCIEEARQFVFESVADLTEDMILGWPVGPERPWEPNHIHSKFRFDVQDNSRGFFISVSVVNPADYGQFIHEPGDPDRLVWEREIVERLEAAQDAIGRGVEELIERCFE